MYDVIVVGAGPAGSICARQLAAAGLQVLVVEKAQFPRHKLCGGGLSRKAVRLLDGIVDLQQCNPIPLTGSYLCYRNEHLTYTSEEAAGYSVSRSAFDDLLLSAAREAGCEVLIPAEVIAAKESDASVTITTGDGRTLEGRFLVVAAGMHGKLQEQLGYTGRREITMALELDVVPRYFPERLRHNTLFDLGSIPGGYAWVFPKNGFVNVGAYWYRCSTLGPEGRDLPFRFLRRFDWSAGAEIGKLRGYPLPCHVEYAAYHTPRTLLVGDAAGMVENLFGEGIYYALRSGMVASEVLCRACTAGLPLSDYTQRLQAGILAQIRVSRNAAHWLYTHQRFGYYRAVRNRIVNHLYADTIHGTLSPRQAMLRMLLLLPLWPFAGNIREADAVEIGLHHPADNTQTVLPV